MMHIRYIEFCRDSYKENGEYNDSLMWADILTTLKILTKNDYVCSFKCEDERFYVLEFEYANAEIADHYLYWLDGEEADKVDKYRISGRKDEII